MSGPAIAWTEFTSQEATTAARYVAPWSGLIERIRDAGPFSSKEACLWVKLATFGGKRTTKDCLRHGDNVKEIFGIEGDYDGEEVAPGEAIEMLERAGLRAIVYTSPSHTTERPRWRVLAPLAAPVAKEHRAGLVARLNGVLGGLLAGESFTLAQAYYFGRVEGRDYQVLVAFDDPEEGRCIDEADELDQIAIGKREKDTRGDAGPGCGERPGESTFASKVDALGRKLRSGDGRREMLKAYIASRSALGFPVADIGLLIDGIAARYFDPADPIDHHNVREIVAWARGKDAPPPAHHAPAEGDEATDDTLPPLNSEDDLAAVFVHQYGDRFRFTPGMGWMVDDGTAWRRDHPMSAFEASRQVCRRAAMEEMKAADRRKVASAKTRAAVLSIAQADPAIVVPASAWDAEPMLLNTPGGIVDLRTGMLRPRVPTDLVTQAARLAPAMGTTAPTFLKFIREVFADEPELVDFVQRMLGYCLTGDRREQVMFFWHGVGANGKSTLLDLVQWLVGDYGGKLQSSELMASRLERHPAGLAGLRGRRLAVSSELEEGQFWNESLIKELTGDTTLTARFMRQDFFEFDMTHKHVIVGNYKPRLRGGDPALARRLVLVPFLVTFSGAQRDPGMLDKLKAEGPAILAWMVEGAMKWHADGLRVPTAVRAASAEYLAEHDDLALWADECCNRSGEAKAGDLYASFALWKKARGENAPSMTAWGGRLALLPGVSRRKTKSGNRYAGLSLRAEELARSVLGAFA